MDKNKKPADRAGANTKSNPYPISQEASSEQTRTMFVSYDCVAW